MQAAVYQVAAVAFQEFPDDSQGAYDRVMSATTESGALAVLSEFSRARADDGRHGLAYEAARARADDGRHGLAYEAGRTRWHRTASTRSASASRARC